ncbi:SLAM family member 5-like isoform X2 [Mixophyes fleayi]
MICLSRSLVGIYLLKCILCEGLCGERRHVIGTLGGDVILRVDGTGIMGDITWFISGNHFATTDPGGHINIRDNQYNGKLYGLAGGSLNITELDMVDQGIYTASTLRNTSTKEELCAQVYDLRIYRMLSEDDIHIEHNVTSMEPCSMTFTCTVNRSDVNVTWSSSVGSDINVTDYVLYVSAPDPKMIYTCTAQNHISTSSNSVTPWEY